MTTYITLLAFEQVLQNYLLEMKSWNHGELHELFLLFNLNPIQNLHIHKSAPMKVFIFLFIIHMMAIWTHVKFINHHPQLWYFCNPLNLRTNNCSLLLYDSKKFASNLQCITIKTKIYSPQFIFLYNIFINLVKFCSNNEVMQHACKWPKVFSYLESMVGLMF